MCTNRLIESLKKYPEVRLSYIINDYNTHVFTFIQSFLF